MHPEIWRVAYQLKSSNLHPSNSESNFPLSKGQLKALEDGYKVVLMSELLRRNSQVKKKSPATTKTAKIQTIFEIQGPVSSGTHAIAVSWQDGLVAIKFLGKSQNAVTPQIAMC